MLPDVYPWFYPRKRHGNVCQHPFVSSKSANFLLMSAVSLLLLSSSLFSSFKYPASTFHTVRTNFHMGWGFTESAAVRLSCHFLWSCSFFPLSTVDSFLILLFSHFVDFFFFSTFLYRTVRNLRFLFCRMKKNISIQKCFILQNCYLRDPH